MADITKNMFVRQKISDESAQSISRMQAKRQAETTYITPKVDVGIHSSQLTAYKCLLKFRSHVEVKHPFHE